MSTLLSFTLTQGMGLAILPIAMIGAAAAFYLVHHWSSASSQIETRSDWSVREQFAVDLKKAMRLRVEKEFDQANAILNSLLRRDPEWPEALFLKAQVMWEGFGNVGSAKSYLEKIMKMKQVENVAIMDMANSLYQEFSEIEKM
jgi:hypothetical protein